MAEGSRATGRWPGVARRGRAGSRPRALGAGEALPRLDYAAYLADDGTLLAALAALNTVGLFLLPGLFAPWRACGENRSGDPVGDTVIRDPDHRDPGCGILFGRCVGGHLRSVPG